jgi:hypothetical protein
VELTRRNIPFVKFGGLKFLDSAHVNDVMPLDHGPASTFVPVDAGQPPGERARVAVELV